MAELIAITPTTRIGTKHIEIGCHFVTEKVLSGKIRMSLSTPTKDREDIFTKSLRGFICNKFKPYDMCAPT